MKQTRMFCRGCLREWIAPRASYVNSSPVTITGNPPGLPNCPICGSSDIEQVIYEPDFPGGDIPRGTPRAQNSGLGNELGVDNSPDPNEIFYGE